MLSFLRIARTVPEWSQFFQSLFVAGSMTTFVVLMTSYLYVDDHTSPNGVAALFFLPLMWSGGLVLPLTVIAVRTGMRLVRVTRSLMPFTRQHSRRGDASQELMMLAGGIALVVLMIAAASVYGLR